MQTTRRLLLIFVKNPVLGKVKTRLARTIGNKKALEVYLQLLKHTVQITSHADCNKAVFYSDFIEENDSWPDTMYQKQVQQGNDLGQRMLHAFIWAFGQQYGHVIIIGSDCPQLSTSVIQDAFEHLQTSDAVIGPAADGGYYLLGMKRLIPELFSNKIWSSTSVLADTTEDLQRLQVSYKQLLTLYDVDEEKDLALLAQEIPYIKQAGS